MRLGPHVVTQGTTQCRPPPGPGSRTPGRSPAVGPLRDDREATVLPKPRAAPPARGHGDGLSSMGQLRGHQARPGFGRCEAPLPVNGERYRDGLAALRERAAGPSSAPPPQLPRPEVTGCGRGGSPGLADAGALRAAAISGRGAKLVKGHPPCPWHRCPLQAPGPGRCQQLPGPSCAQAAGGQPVRGPARPAPLAHLGS